MALSIKYTALLVEYYNLNPQISNLCFTTTFTMYLKYMIYNFLTTFIPELT